MGVTLAVRFDPDDMCSMCSGIMLHGTLLVIPVAYLHNTRWSSFSEVYCCVARLGHTTDWTTRRVQEFSWDHPERTYREEILYSGGRRACRARDEMEHTHMYTHGLTLWKSRFGC